MTKFAPSKCIFVSLTLLDKPHYCRAWGETDQF